MFDSDLNCLAGQRRHKAFASSPYLKKEAKAKEWSEDDGNSKPSKNENALCLSRSGPNVTAMQRSALLHCHAFKTQKETRYRFENPDIKFRPQSHDKLGPRPRHQQT
jgi:hypothetical protein